MNVRKRVALLLVAVVLAVVAGCTEPPGTGGPGASAQPAASQGRGDY
ncbi:MAG TPA: hypothetical protein VGQ58_05495 [Candidatus Limnocylindrales bacterium]|jgi:hypothetical protein|nr:hypothetical protein [Candidatus Limnocylindrales bacterium]